MTSMDEEADFQAFETLLRDKRAEISGLIARTAAERAPVELDQTRVGRLSRMDAMQVQAMAQAAEQRRRQELERIDAALARIADGSFGECLVCGELIATKRLELDPAATRCIDCARR